MSVESVRKFAAASLRRFPRLKVAVRRLDRKLQAPVARIQQERHEQRAPLRGVTRALSGNAFIDARLAAVLDGRTLNIDLLAPQFRADDVTAAELHAVRGSVRRTTPARVRREADGSCAVEATALLDDSPGGYALRPGDPWFLEVMLHTRTRGRRILKVLGGRQNAGTTGLTIPSPPHPDTGYRYKARLYWSGRLALTVTPPAATAELSRVELDWTRAELEVRAVGWQLGDESVVEVANRSGTARVTAAAGRVGADRVRCTLPVAELAGLTRTGRETVLNVFVRSDGRRLRVGRVLHDLMNPGRVLKPTPAIIWAGPGSSLRVQVRFTPAGGMSLACRTITPERPNGGA